METLAHAVARKVWRTGECDRRSLRQSGRHVLWEVNVLAIHKVVDHISTAICEVS